MSGSFLDTTVLIELAEPLHPGKAKAEKFVLNNRPAQAPYYASRELLAGHVRYLCDAHNVLQSAQNPGEAMVALLKRSPAEGRKREAKLRAVAEALDAVFGIKPSGSREDLKRDALHSLALRVSRLWNEARKAHRFEHVQPLGCFNDGKITYGMAGELRGPNDSFNCIGSARCGAAGYIHDEAVSLSTLIDALHPKKLDEQTRQKQENQQRRKALKELKSDGPERFDKRRCRALGDAYFAVMCPPGSVVVTTNLSDHGFLCKALSKEAKAP